MIQNKERYDKKFGGSLQNFKIVEEIGRGAFGVVFKVQNSLIPNKFFVLKKIPLTNVWSWNSKSLLKEVSILRKLKHDHIIWYLHSFIDWDAFYILMEYAEGGDVHSVRSFECSWWENIEKRKSWSLRKKFGDWLMKSRLGLNTYTSQTLLTEIWKIWTYFWPKICLLRYAHFMFR